MHKRRARHYVAARRPTLSQLRSLSRLAGRRRQNAESATTDHKMKRAHQMSTITTKDTNQRTPFAVAASRRDFLIGTAALTLDAVLPGGALAQSRPGPLSPNSTNGSKTMSTITTRDGVAIFYKDWGSKNAQPIVFHHGWPLSADDWDTQMLYFVDKGYRVIAHDRRGHGRSTQVSDGHDMDHYAADTSAVVEHLDLSNAVHVGHSTGGGEVAHYLGRHGES